MNIFKRLILTESTSTESGYVSNVNRLELIGREGVTVTPLRPSGTNWIEDERLDVVAEGILLKRMYCESRKSRRFTYRCTRADNHD